MAPQTPDTDSRETLMSFQDVTLAFGPKVIQKGISFDIKRGSIFAVMGGSGCGKSTVLKSMIGLLKPAAGHYLVDGEDYWTSDPDHRQTVSRRFGVLFQSAALWSSLTVGENVALPMQMLTKMDPATVRNQVELAGSGRHAACHRPVLRRKSAAA
jgi:phospholipid/cholesterol/gamma-HCH transport system ATP-binding protein